MPPTAYQRLQKAAGAACRGTGTMAQLRNAAATYKKKSADPVKAKKIADKLVSKPCSIAVSGTKKRKTTTRKKAATPRKRTAAKKR